MAVGLGTKSGQMAGTGGILITVSGTGTYFFTIFAVI